MSIEMTTRRQRRWDAGKMILTERDLDALTWIGEQYAIRIDHLQQWLSDYAGRDELLSFDATRKLVARWHRAGWVEMQRLRGTDPLWIWPTRTGLRHLGRSYSYRNMENNLDDLKHLHATNAIRLEWDEEGARWVSERDLHQEVIRTRGSELLHRPDAELWYADGSVVAIEAELSQKKPEDLAENLMELVRGERYIELKGEYGKAEARERSVGAQSQYTDIWYFGDEVVRRQVMRERWKLLAEGALCEEEAKRIFVRWYPLAKPEQVEQEEQEDKRGLETGGTSERKRVVRISTGRRNRR
jgi:hypothetical protein